MQGVDYSGTNVQEQGVDEPDLVKTNGKTLFALANGNLEPSTCAPASRACSTRCRSTAGYDSELLLYGDRLLVLSRGGYWAEPLPALARTMIAYAPSQSTLTEVDVSDPGALRIVAHADARRLVPRRAHGRRDGSHRRQLVDPGDAEVRAARGLDEGRARRGDDAQPRGARLVARLELAAVVPHQARRATPRRASARSCSAATSAGRPASRASGC